MSKQEIISIFFLQSECSNYLSISQNETATFQEAHCLANKIHQHEPIFWY